LTEIRKGKAYEIFAGCRDRGLSITESAKDAGVSKPTGSRWDKARIASQVATGQRSGPVGREELVGLYSDALRASPPQTVAQIGAAFQKIMGFETAPETEALTWPSATIGWIDEEHRRLSARTHACSEIPIVPPRSPNAESNEFIESPAQNLQKKGGSND